MIFLPGNLFPLFLFSIEPFHGTICLYNRERREKLSEDFYFRALPTETQDVSESVFLSFSYDLAKFDDRYPSTNEVVFGYHHQSKMSNEPRGIFYLDAPSASVCLLIQLEKLATEEGGVTSSVYSRKEPVCVSTP